MYDEDEIKRVELEAENKRLRIALDTYKAAADKFIAKCETGRAHSRETQAELRAAREASRQCLAGRDEDR